MPIISRADIDQAAHRLGSVAVRTPLIDVSHHTSHPLSLKCENLQVAGAFKIRGAYNKVATLPAAARRGGVITYSSGNHAQAVAYAARLLEVPAVVVMPTTAPAIKVTKTRGYGAEVLFEGTTSEQRRVRAESVAQERGLTMVPPFDDPAVIAGQATVGQEIHAQEPDVARVYVPIGGGGLISGVAAALKLADAHVVVIGVEPVGAACMAAARAAGQPTTLEATASVADGLLPVRAGDLTFAHVQRFVDDVVTVEDDAIVDAVGWLFDRAKLVVEPSGAASVAAALACDPPAREKTVAVVSGGNVAASAFCDLLSRSDATSPRR